MRMLANVPRIITSWLPRRAPYWLKSLSGTPCADQVLPRRAVRRDVAGRRDVIGRDAVAQIRPAPSRRRCRTASPARSPCPRRTAAPGCRCCARIPLVQLAASGTGTSFHISLPREDVAVLLAEHLGVQARRDAVAHLRLASARCRAGRPARRRCPCPAAPASGRCRPCRPARRPPPAAGWPGSSPAPADGRGPRSCGCRTAPPPPPGRLRRSAWRSPRAAGRCCRCRSCSRSRPSGSPSVSRYGVSPAASQIAGHHLRAGRQAGLDPRLDLQAPSRPPSSPAGPRRSSRRGCWCWCRR